MVPVRLVWVLSYQPRRKVPACGPSLLGWKRGVWVQVAPGARVVPKQPAKLWKCQSSSTPTKLNVTDLLPWLVIVIVWSAKLVTATEPKSAGLGAAVSSGVAIPVMGTVMVPVRVVSVASYQPRRKVPLWTPSVSGWKRGVWVQVAPGARV